VGELYGLKGEVLFGCPFSESFEAEVVESGGVSGDECEVLESVGDEVVCRYASECAVVGADLDAVFEESVGA